MARAATAAPSDPVIRPVSGQDTTRIATTMRRVTSGRRGGFAAGQQVVESRTHLGEVGGQLVHDERHVRERDDRQTCQPGGQDRPALAARRPAADVGHQERADDRQQRHPQDVALHRGGRPDGRQEPPPGRPVDHARHAPANATALVRAIRFGFQMKVDSSIAEAETAINSPATMPATGPAMERASHHVTPTAAIPNSAICHVTASGESPPVNAADGASR